MGRVSADLLNILKLFQIVYFRVRTKFSLIFRYYYENSFIPTQWSLYLLKIISVLKISVIQYMCILRYVLCYFSPTSKFEFERSQDHFSKKYLVIQSRYIWHRLIEILNRLHNVNCIPFNYCFRILNLEKSKRSYSMYK